LLVLSVRGTTLDYILVERARRRNLKRGGGALHVSLEEAAEVLKVSPVAVRRDLRTAKAWLYRELTGVTDEIPIAGNKSITCCSPPWSSPLPSARSF
jgi:hypothetical protein